MHKGQDKVSIYHLPFIGNTTTTRKMYNIYENFAGNNCSLICFKDTQQRKIYNI